MAPIDTPTRDTAEQILDHADAVIDVLVEDYPEQASQFVQQLERRLSSPALGRIERVWGLSGSKVAAAFGVSRPAYSKWKEKGVPPARAVDVATLDTATTILLDNVSVVRIPAVVRRPADFLDGASLLELVGRGAFNEALEAVRYTFDLRRVQP